MSNRSCLDDPSREGLRRREKAHRDQRQPSPGGTADGECGVQNGELGPKKSDDISTFEPKSSSEITATGETSEPVPAVVGIAIPG